MPAPDTRLDVARGFSANLIGARKRLGISQEELGYRASLHRTEISQVEQGIRLPRIDTAIKLAGALEVAVASLFEGIEWERGHFSAGGFRVSPPPGPDSLPGDAEGEGR